jgi:hypothetical protein
LVPADAVASTGSGDASTGAVLSEPASATGMASWVRHPVRRSETTTAVRMVLFMARVLGEE